MGESKRVSMASVQRMWRRFSLGAGGLVFLLCVASITHSLVFRYAYCPVCDARMAEIRDYGESTERQATFYECPKCRTGLIR